MDLREKINQNPQVVTSITLVILTVIGIAMLRQLKSPRAQRTITTAPRKVFYTTDDGATVFTDLDTKAAPFDSKGKPAVRAYVFHSGQAYWVAYLEKYQDGPGSLLLVKKPHSGEWIAESDPGAQAIRQPTSADGWTGTPAFPSNE